MKHDLCPRCNSMWSPDPDGSPNVSICNSCSMMCISSPNDELPPEYWVDVGEYTINWDWTGECYVDGCVITTLLPFDVTEDGIKIAMVFS